MRQLNDVIHWNTMQMEKLQKIPSLTTLDTKCVESFIPYIPMMNRAMTLIDINDKHVNIDLVPQTAIELWTNTDLTWFLT